MLAGSDQDLDQIARSLWAGEWRMIRGKLLADAALGGMEHVFLLDLVGLAGEVLNLNGLVVE